MRALRNDSVDLYARPSDYIEPASGSRITASRTRQDCDVFVRERCCGQRRIASVGAG